MSAGKKIIIIAGPNGAGKTGFAQEYLAREATNPAFINADSIAIGISPEAPETAKIQSGRIMLEKIDLLVAKGKSFALETTLSGRGYDKKIREWRAEGYRVELEFLSLQTPEEAVKRVALRFYRGGHKIPEATIRRRFHRGLKNLEEIYCKCVDTWRFFDNIAFFDNTTDQPILLKRGRTMKPVETALPTDPDDRIALHALQRAAKRAHFIAYQNGTGVVIRKNGKIVLAPPDPEMYGELLAAVERKRAAVEAEYAKENEGC